MIFNYQTVFRATVGHLSDQVGYVDALWLYLGSDGVIDLAPWVPSVFLRLGLDGLPSSVILTVSVRLATDCDVFDRVTHFAFHVMDSFAVHVRVNVASTRGNGVVCLLCRLTDPSIPTDHDQKQNGEISTFGSYLDLSFPRRD